MGRGRSHDRPSQRAYAAAAGLSRGTVSELIDAGMPGRGFRAIDKESADAWRAANIDPARTDAARRGLAEPAGKPRKNGKCPPRSPAPARSTAPASQPPAARSWNLILSLAN